MIRIRFAPLVTLLLTGTLLLLLGEVALAQGIDKTQPRRIEGSLKNSRSGYDRFNRGAQQTPGHAQYRQIAVLDGNLVSGPVTNSGVISHGGIGQDIRVGWPKGALFVEYIWGAFFYVGAEVISTSGDTLRIVSDNIPGDDAPDGTHEYAFMPLPGYYNLDRPGSLTDPFVRGISEDLGIDGIPNSGDFGEGDGRLQPQEDFNGNGVLDLSMQNAVNWFAISHRRETWPTFWPPQSYPGDTRDSTNRVPGIRAMRWNGEYGAYTRADQEAYYVMDDRENDEFDYYPFGDTRDWPDGRRGLGMKVENRFYQWNARLAEDILISIYEIQNEGRDIEDVVVGMYVDPDLGGIQTNDDALFDRADDITYSWNKLGTTSQGIPTGYFGFAFLESPGKANDGIDNDGDGLLDESQTDGIDNDGDWTPWEDLNGNGTWDTEDLNYNGVLDPGEDIDGNGRIDYEPLNDDLGADGLGPQFFEYTGPDADGSEANGLPDQGEPNFDFTDNDESDQVGLTSFYLRSTQAAFGYGGRNDEHYITTETVPGTFETVPGYQTDISFTYGSGYIPFARDERNHRYAIAMVFGNDFDDILRNKRTIQVIYDNDYNFSKPPRQPQVTANGDNGRVYLNWDDGAERSRDPIYGEDFEAYRIYRSTDPTFNAIRTITDSYGNPFLFEPMAIFDLDNGLKGAHPVIIGSELGGDSNLGVTYIMGTDSGLEHNYIDTTVVNGRTYYYAVASIDQGYHPSFFDQGISILENLSPISPTESPFLIQVDPLGRPISFDPNTVQVIPTERSAGWVEPGMAEAGVTQTAGRGTGTVSIEIYNPLVVPTGHTYRISFGDDGAYEGLDSTRYTGNLDFIQVYSVTDDAALLADENPVNRDRSEKFIIDGFRLLLHNDTTAIDTLASGWTSGDTQLEMTDLTESQFNRVNRNFELRVLEADADTAINRRTYNFQVWDVTDPDDPVKMKYSIIDKNQLGILDNGDDVTIRSPIVTSQRMYRFLFDFPADVDTADWRMPEPGDVFTIITRKTFDRNDVLEFSVAGNEVRQEEIENDLDDIYTVPDPYVAVNRLERKVFNEEEGRGDRKIDFVNLPPRCTVSIFTVSGKLVQTLQHEAEEDNRRLSWDLRTKDGLEIAHGMYFYVVEVPGVGTKTGKFAVIK